MAAVRFALQTTWIVAGLVLGGADAPGQVAHRQAAETELELTVANIMKGPELVGTSPSRLRWALDGSHLYFVWKAPGEEREGLYRVRRGGGEPERVADDEARGIEARLSASRSENRRWAAYEYEGELHLIDLRSDDERVLLSVPGRLSNIQLAPDGSAVYFVLQDNLFRIDAASGSLTQLTDIRRGREPGGPKELDDQARYLKQEQQALLQVFRADSIRRAHDWPPPPDTAQVDTPKVFYIRQGENLGGYWVSPDGKRMAFSVSKRAEDVRLAWVPDYVTDDGYTEQAPRKRPLVGDEQSDVRLGIMDLVTGEVVWVDHGQEDREVNLMFRGWSPESDRLLTMGISSDAHDRWVLLVDGESGESRVLEHLHDDAWIGGPAWSSAGWLPDGDHVWFVSEASGFAHLYTVAEGGGDPTPLTTGPWEVHGVELSPDERAWYLLTSESSPHERGFYQMDLKGGERRLISQHGTLQGSGGDPVAVAPDGRRLGLLYARPNQPPELFLQDNKRDASASRITLSTTPEFRSRQWIVPEIVYFEASDGQDVPARLYRPSQPNGAAVIFVHGAGYLQNVHSWWSSYYREYMFHNLLAARGYTVLDIDYRGSAGYGRDWRTAIHKNMGGKDLTDQVDGAAFLVDSLGIDPERLGIYGGSYGGFITLMAMFTRPAVFAAGAALRPVTDWAYYNHWYTSRILGLPQDDPEAYRRSSPIYHAEGLEGSLLIAHGMIDQNVHFQDTVRLAERLIELGKKNWDVAMYPKEDHGFVNSWSWTDEYRRILELFERNLSVTSAFAPLEPQ